MSRNIDIRQLAAEEGFSLSGVCKPTEPAGLSFFFRWLDEGNHAGMEYMADSVPLRSCPATLLPEVRSIIVLGLEYNQPNEPQTGMPRISKYALGRDYHKVMRSKLRSLQRRLQAENGLAKFRICVDSAPIFEREFAHMAGLGWFGKNTCLINSKIGSLFFIGLLLTDLELPIDEPALGGCGTCRKCIDACPTGAITYANGRGMVDANRCISYLTIEHRGEIPKELATKIGDWTFGCDICQDVCPFNRPRANQPFRAAIAREPDFLAKRSWPALNELIRLDRESWDALTAGSPVRRAGYEGLLRNARINLANQGDGGVGRIRTAE